MSKLDAEQVIKEAFNESEGALETTSVGSASAQVGQSKLDWRQIVKAVFDGTKIRTVE